MATLEELQDDLALHKAARRRILEGAQEVRAGQESYRFADLAQLEQAIEGLERRVAMLRAHQSGGGVNYSTPVFRGRR